MLSHWGWTASNKSPGLTRIGSSSIPQQLPRSLAPRVPTDCSLQAHLCLSLQQRDGSALIVHQVPDASSSVQAWLSTFKELESGTERCKQQGYLSCIQGDSEVIT